LKFFLINEFFLGVLIGDCLGSDFEGIRNPNLSDLIHFLNNLKNDTQHEFKYTDDTALTKAVCASILQSKGLDVQNLAELLVTSYNNEPWRGYAGGAVSLFKDLGSYKLKNKLKEKAFHPALNLFDETGSFGNGSGE
jgi:ADP-ribosylglycohydrolase